MHDHKEPAYYETNMEKSEIAKVSDEQKEKDKLRKKFDDIFMNGEMSTEDEELFTSQEPIIQ